MSICTRTPFKAKTMKNGDKEKQGYATLGVFELFVAVNSAAIDMKPSAGVCRLCAARYTISKYCEFIEQGEKAIER